MTTLALESMVLGHAVRPARIEELARALLMRNSKLYI